jgi:hypothetical protein
LEGGGKVTSGLPRDNLPLMGPVKQTVLMNPSKIRDFVCTSQKKAPLGAIWIDAPADLQVGSCKFSAT